MKAWLKGGLIGAVAHLVYFLISLPWILTGGETLIAWIFIFTELLPVELIFRSIDLFNDNNLISSFFLVGLIVTIYWFIIGALIGWIVGKIKSRNN